MKVLKSAVVLLMAVLGLVAGAPAMASPAPDTQADIVLYPGCSSRNGVVLSQCPGDGLSTLTTSWTN